MVPRFLWGAATSAHQVEGYTIHNDWWAWERAHPQGPQSGRGVDHYHRFREDFALAHALGHTAHRLSLEWSRLEVKPGVWNYAAVAHYREVLETLRRRQLTSFVTLLHFTIPQWLAAQGGWVNPAAPRLFERYVQFVAETLGDLVDIWLTINEPVVYALQSYWERRWPPQQRSLRQVQLVVRHLAIAHQRAYRVIHRRFPAARVGLAQHMLAFIPARPARFTDRLGVQLASWWYNHRFLDITAGSHDLLGVNYYSAAQIQGWPPQWRTGSGEGERSDLGWPIYPEGLVRLLLQLRRYRLPIYITENGLADAADTRRPDFIRHHVRAIETAQAQGADVRGYLHWSLLDTFEWADGFIPRFGLVAVDLATQTRTPRPSAYVLKAIIEQSASGAELSRY